MVLNSVLGGAEVLGSVLAAVVDKNFLRKNSDSASYLTQNIYGQKAKLLYSMRTFRVNRNLRIRKHRTLNKKSYCSLAKSSPNTLLFKKYLISGSPNTSITAASPRPTCAPKITAVCRNDSCAPGS